MHKYTFAGGLVVIAVASVIVSLSAVAGDMPLTEADLKALRQKAESGRADARTVLENRQTSGPTASGIGLESAFPSVTAGHESSSPPMASVAATEKPSKAPVVLDAATEADIIASDDTSVTFKGMPDTIWGVLWPGDIFVAQGEPRRVVSVYSIGGDVVVNTQPPQSTEGCSDSARGNAGIVDDSKLRDGVRVLDAATEALIKASDDTSLTFSGIPTAISTFKPGDVFLAQGEPRRVVSVTSLNGNAFLRTELPPINEVFESISIGGTMNFSSDVLHPCP